MSRWPGDAREQDTPFGDLSRSELMSRVRNTGNATTELAMARLLQSAGLTGWRRHVRLPGRPDFAWPKLKVALFVDGCFWHGHDCSRNLSPRTNAPDWEAKFERNRKRDRRVTRELRSCGWSVLRIWECELRKQPKRSVARVKRILTRKGNLTSAKSARGRSTTEE